MMPLEELLKKLLGILFRHHLIWDFDVDF